MQKNNKLLKHIVVTIVLFISSISSAFAQVVYQHSFGTTTINTHPYTVAPSTQHPDILNSSWSNSTNAWTNFGGATGEAIALANSSGTPTITLNFTIAPGKQLNVASFNFWVQRSNTGAQNWSMTINGINAGTGSIPTGGTPTGITPVANTVSGLTGNIAVVIRLSGATGNGSFRLDDFTLNGTVTPTCTAPVVTSVVPVSAPANTIVTITGSGFQSGTGTSAVTFNGVAATNFTVVSNTVIRAIVPATATTGPINITTNNCEGTGTTFTLLSSNCAPAPAELFISEVYDARLGANGAIELYNGTGAPIDLSAYSLVRRGDVGGPIFYTVALSGIVPNGGIHIARTYDPTEPFCGFTGVPSSRFLAGFNEDDEIELVKNNVVIDRFYAPDNAGFTMIRNADAVVPNIVYNTADWAISNTENCANLGMHTINAAGPVITAQPQNASACENGSATFSVTLNTTIGLSYQWKVLNNAGVWVNVVNGVNYAGATTATLTVNQVPVGFTGNQYYCEIVAAGCIVYSNAAQLTVFALPAVPVTVTTPATCTVKGAISVTTPRGTGITYSIDGITFQPSPDFANLDPNNYTITVKNAEGCTATSAIITIAPVQNIPPITTTQLQPTCTTPKGSITITAPTGIEYSYSIDGVTFQDTAVFANLDPNTYTITVKNGNCTATSQPIIITAVPNAPAIAQTTQIQPTCALPTGTIRIDTPVGPQYTYSIDGVNFTANPLFTGLTPNNYTITVKNTDNCLSVTPVITINAVPNSITAVQANVAQPTCSDTTGIIIVTNPLDPAIVYSIDGVNFQSGTTFINLAPDTYTVTAKNTDGCTSSQNFTINPSTGQPMVGTTQGCESTVTGKDYVLHVEALNNSFNADNAFYEWKIVDGNFAGTNDSSFNVTQYALGNNIPLEAFPLKFEVTVTTPEGCETSAIFTVDGTFCTIPKGISPNNDTKNDSFNLTGLNVKKLNIFNRYGKEVYQRNNYTNEWFGQSENGDNLPTGTYYYVIEPAGGETKTGWVYINREEN